MTNIDSNAWIIEGDERGRPGGGRRRHGRHGGHEGHGPGAHGFGPGFGPGFGGPRGRGPGGRGGRNRGDIRAAVLALLAEQSRHGYDLIRAIEERTSGAWAPSPGSIYPTLQSLADEGMLVIDEVDGRKVASLTDAGRAWVEENVADPDALFQGARVDDAMGQVRAEMMQLRDAAVHVARQLHTEEDAAKVAAILAGARKDLYRLLTDRD